MYCLSSNILIIQLIGIFILFFIINSHNSSHFFLLLEIILYDNGILCKGTEVVYIEYLYLLYSQIILHLF